MSLTIHKKLRGKIEIKPKIKISKANLHLLYTPGVGKVAKEIAKDITKTFDYTAKGNNVCILTDGSRTIGVGDSFPEASLPVMEGKAMLAKTLGDVDAWPLCLNTKDQDEIIRTIEILTPNFSLFNIEDIRAPKCFYIFEELEKRNINVFFDDRQGVGIVILAGLLNGLKLVNKKIKDIRICLVGAGVAGYGIFEILNYLEVRNIIVLDKDGIIHKGRKQSDGYLKNIIQNSNPENITGGLKEAIKKSDVFIGLSGVGNLLKAEEIKLMNKKPIIFALSNPVPEIFPQEIEKSVKDYIFASGRSDFVNQVNNILVFPGVFRGLLQTGKKMSLKMEVEIARKISSLVRHPRKNKIVPDPFDKNLVKEIVKTIKNFKNK